jgi:hypothetical protein
MGKMFANVVNMVWSVDGRGVIEVLSLHTHEESDKKIGNVRTAQRFGALGSLNAFFLNYLTRHLKCVSTLKFSAGRKQ